MLTPHISFMFQLKKFMLLECSSDSHINTSGAEKEPWTREPRLSRKRRSGRVLTTTTLNLEGATMNLEQLQAKLQDKTICVPVLIWRPGSAPSLLQQNFPVHIRPYLVC